MAEGMARQRTRLKDHFLATTSQDPAVKPSSVAWLLLHGRVVDVQTLGSDAIESSVVEHYDRVRVERQALQREERVVRLNHHIAAILRPDQRERLLCFAGIMGGYGTRIGCYPC